jgi:hypothetical protein
MWHQIVWQIRINILVETAASSVCPEEGSFCSVSHISNNDSDYCTQHGVSGTDCLHEQYFPLEFQQILKLTIIPF